MGDPKPLSSSQLGHLRELLRERPQLRDAAHRLRLKAQAAPTAVSLQKTAGRALSVVPGAGMAIGAALRAAPDVSSMGRALAQQLGLTADADYEGWVPLLGLLYYFLWPPVKMAWGIEKQVAAVLDQLFKWLGGAGSALQRGEQLLIDMTGIGLAYNLVSAEISAEQSIVSGASSYFGGATIKTVTPEQAKKNAAIEEALDAYAKANGLWWLGT